jgi:hypothetical protein
MTTALLRALLLLTGLTSALIAGAIGTQRSSPPADWLAYTGTEVLQVFDAAHGLAARLRVDLPPHTTLNYYNWDAGGHLVFAVAEAGQGDIYLTDLTGYINLSDHPANDVQPALSRDGRVAFVSDRDGNDEIYVWQAGALTNLSQSPEPDFQPAWSADGRLAWIHAENKLLVYDGGRIEQVAVERGRWVVSPAWSADGRLAWCAYFGLRCDIMLWDGVSVSRVYRATSFSRPVWSADGRLAFKSDRLTLSVWDGERIESFQPSAANIGFPAWDAGGWLTFQSLQAGPAGQSFRSRLYRWAGGAAHLLLEAERIESPVWMPAG